MKRIFRMTFFTLLLTLFFGLTAFADQIYTEGCFEYRVEEEAVIICGYFGKETEVKVPASIAGNPVSVIARGAFSSSETVKKVQLPDTIMTIEKGAFASETQVVYGSNTEDSKQDVGKDTSSESSGVGNNEVSSETGVASSSGEESSVEIVETDISSEAAEDETGDKKDNPPEEKEETEKVDGKTEVGENLEQQTAGDSHGLIVLVIGILVIFIAITVCGVRYHLKKNRK